MTRRQLINLHKEATDDLKDMIVYALTNDPLTRDDDEVDIQPALEERINPKEYGYGTGVRLADGDIYHITQIGYGIGILVGHYYNRLREETFKLPITKAQLEIYLSQDDYERKNYLPITIIK